MIGYCSIIFYLKMVCLCFILGKENHTLFDEPKLYKEKPVTYNERI